MYTLHIANKNYSSWSLRPWVLLKELGIPFEEVLSPFSSGSNWEAFRNFSPTGLVPCLVDEPIVVWDSLAIIEYIAEQHPQTWPASPQARAWARSASAEMHSGFSAVRDQCSMNCGIRVKLNAITDALQTDLKRFDELWLQGLEKFGGPFLAGTTFTAVDAFYAPVVFRLQTYGLKLSEPATTYANRILELDSMKGWYQAAISETWREPGHEQETLDYGQIVEDFRAPAE